MLWTNQKRRIVSAASAHTRVLPRSTACDTAVAAATTAIAAVALATELSCMRITIIKSLLRIWR